MIEYSPIAALNRTYALAKVYGNEQAIAEAEKLKLNDNHLYHTLLGELYTTIDRQKAKEHFEIAVKLSRSSADKKLILSKIKKLLFWKPIMAYNEKLADRVREALADVPNVEEKKNEERPTVTIAIAGSIINNTQSLELATRVLSSSLLASFSENLSYIYILVIKKKNSF